MIPSPGKASKWSRNSSEETIQEVWAGLKGIQERGGTDIQAPAQEPG